MLLDGNIHFSFSQYLTFVLRQFSRFVRPHASHTFILNQFISSNENAMLGTTIEIVNALNSSIILACWRIELNSHPCAGLQME